MVGTYRLQLSPEFTFKDAEAILPYLHRLGISHLYLSPISEATPGSTHGYDVTDHNAIREDLGGREGFELLEKKAREFGLGIIIDFVPNHAGVGPENAYWQDVLAYGPHSLYASYFDIDWTPLKPELQEKILLPFLGSPYGDVFDRGEIGLSYADGWFYATYFAHRFALAPATYRHILGPALAGFLMGVTAPSALPIFFVVLFAACSVYAFIQARSSKDRIVEEPAHFVPMVHSTDAMLEMALEDQIRPADPASATDPADTGRADSVDDADTTLSDDPEPSSPSRP